MFYHLKEFEGSYADFLIEEGKETKKKLEEKRLQQIEKETSSF